MIGFVPMLIEILFDEIHHVSLLRPTSKSVVVVNDVPNA